MHTNRGFSRRRFGMIGEKPPVIPCSALISKENRLVITGESAMSAAPPRIRRARRVVIPPLLHAPHARRNHHLVPPATSPHLYRAAHGTSTHSPCAAPATLSPRRVLAAPVMPTAITVPRYPLCPSRNGYGVVHLVFMNNYYHT